MRKLGERLAVAEIILHELSWGCLHRGFGAARVQVILIATTAACLFSCHGTSRKRV